MSRSSGLSTWVTRAIAVSARRCDHLPARRALLNVGVIRIRVRAVEPVRRHLRRRWSDARIRRRVDISVRIGTVVYPWRRIHPRINHDTPPAAPISVPVAVMAISAPAPSAPTPTSACPPQPPACPLQPPACPPQPPPCPNPPCPPLAWPPPPCPPPPPPCPPPPPPCAEAAAHVIASISPTTTPIPTRYPDTLFISTPPVSRALARCRANSMPDPAGTLNPPTPARPANRPSALLSVLTLTMLVRQGLSRICSVDRRKIDSSVPSQLLRFCCTARSAEGGADADSYATALRTCTRSRVRSKTWTPSRGVVRLRQPG